MQGDKDITPRDHARPLIELGEEVETASGWRTTAELRWPDLPACEVTVTLSWADHDLISGGAAAPSETMEAAIAVAAAWFGPPEGPVGIPPRFDVSTLRRRITDFDAAVTRAIRRRSMIDD
ncbi:MAG: hypothetical protein CMJ31_08500 [Phycisphaerae bacterium]|nr:hypothetical protein [Phycisphaerae bacterium]